MTRNPGAHYTAATLALVLAVGASCTREAARSDTANVPPNVGATPPAGAGATVPPAAGANAPATGGASPAPRPYRMSAQGLERIRTHEAYIGKVYDDGVGNRTVGYGHMLRPGESFPGGLTVAQAQELFAKDVERIVSPVLDRIKIQLTQNQVDAIGSFVFNVGPGNFSRSILPNLNLGNHRGVLASMFKFITGRNQRTGERVTMRGLVKRRQEEIALYKQGAGLALLPGQDWPRSARRLLANGMQYLRTESVCVFGVCLGSRSPS